MNPKSILKVGTARKEKMNLEASKPRGNNGLVSPIVVGSMDKSAKEKDKRIVATEDNGKDLQVEIQVVCSLGTSKTLSPLADNPRKDKVFSSLELRHKSKHFKTNRQDYEDLFGMDREK